MDLNHLNYTSVITFLDQSLESKYFVMKVSSWCRIEKYARLVPSCGRIGEDTVAGSKGDVQIKSQKAVKITPQNHFNF